MKADDKKRDEVSHEDKADYSLSRMAALARPEWRPILVGTIFLAISTVMGLAYPQAIKVILDTALGGDDPKMVDTAALTMGAIFLVQGVSTAWRSYLFTVAGERIVARLRTHLFSKVILQDIAFFDSRRTGELLNRLSSDTTVLQNTVSVNISMALRNLASTVGAIALLFYTSAALTTVMLAIVPAVALGASFFGRRIRKLSRDVQDSLAEASEIAEETLSGVRTVRSFAREPQEIARYGKAVERSFQTAKRRASISATFFGGMTFAGYAAVAVVLWYGGHLVIDGGMSVGELTSFVLYTLIVAFSIGALGGLWADFMRASGAAQRVFGLLDRENTMRQKQGETLTEFEPSVRFEGVGFSYPSRPDVKVLDGIDLEMKPGEVVALVGQSGGGKSTIASLISRFYDPNEGAIYLGGKNIIELEPDWLRDQVGVVSQEPILFSTSVKENILYGRPTASDEEVLEAAKAAYAHDFVSAFPDGYETLVGERGVQLSGGQKQRVAIARALLKDPAVLILDEATSALDAESESLVRVALEHLMKGRTTLVIAHRLSTIKDADRVVVIDQGRVAEQGNHHHLIERDGIYKKLVEKQFASAHDHAA